MQKGGSFEKQPAPVMRGQRDLGLFLVFPSFSAMNAVGTGDASPVSSSGTIFFDFFPFMSPVW